MNADQEDLEYYRKTFGFDPDADLTILEGPPRVFRYEASFPLANDFLLNRAGVEICARTEMDAYRIRNRIIFRRGEREAVVDCVHTAVSTLDPAMLLSETGDVDEERLEQVASTEQQQTRLPLAAHFASLKSYVAGIAELGIGNILA
ncbi:MAG TPA: hypothetical protein VKK79_26250, partial [Candidatus Lokiarchaeia archaeon]|nr:hypothetical protein [Candidatus Lokiarchaeia archaeon]